MSTLSLILRVFVPGSLLLVCMLPLRGAHYTVSSVADFAALPSTLQAGDTVEIAAGTYIDLNTKTFRGIGTAGAPIVIYANPLGGAKFEGETSFILDGDYITLAGLVFDGNGGPRSSNGVLQFEDNSYRCRITNCRINDFDQGFTYGPWVFMEGFENRFDHNTLEGKVSGNTTIFVKPDPNNEAGAGTKRLHQIDHNYFGPRTVIGANGYEAIRVSDSARQGYDMSIVVEYNYFYRAIVSESGGEPEVISNKSKGNIYRYNTFRESDGQITLRHGDDCVVEGNFFLGTGGSQESGVRIIGENHVVKNNYFQDLNGTGLRAALVLMKGDSNWSSSDDSNGYEAPNNALIANNTFVHCKVPLNLGEEATVVPVGTRIYNNLVISAASNSAVFDLQMPTSSITFGGNIVYHPSSNYGATGLNGVTYGVNPNHSLSGSLGYYIPSSSSASVDAGSSFTPTNTLDVTGRSRFDGSIDVGAVEFGLSGPVLNAPLVRADVGPAYNEGPSGSFTFPGAPDAMPDLTVASFADAPVNGFYSAFATAVSGDAPLTFSISSGSLPTGLGLNSSTGEISGTATLAESRTFTLRVTDGDGDFDEETFRIAAVILDLFPVITTTTLSSAEFDDYYSGTLSVAEGDAPFTWAYTGALPAGLQLTSGGVFIGRVSEVGVFPFTVTVTDRDGDTDDQDLSLTVSDTSAGFGSYLEVGGQVVVEAEGYTSRTSGVGKSWTEVTVLGATGDLLNNALQALPNSGGREDAPGMGPSVSYSVLITNPADYVVHVRAQGPDGSSDSIFVTVDGDTSDFLTLNLSSSGWEWDRSTSKFTLGAGIHTIDIWMREPGSILDRIVLNQSTTNLSGTGPLASPDPVFPLTFGRWKLERLGDSSLPDSHDPEVDGYSLIEEYFWDLDPTAVDAPGARPYITHTGTQGVVHFRYNEEASDLKVLVRASDDLQLWDVKLADSELTPLPILSGGWATITEIDPTSSSPRFYEIEFDLR